MFPLRIGLLSLNNVKKFISEYILQSCSIYLDLKDFFPKIFNLHKKSNTKSTNWFFFMVLKEQYIKVAKTGFYAL